MNPNSRRSVREFALLAVSVGCAAVIVWRLWPGRRTDARGLSTPAAELAGRVTDADERVAEQAVVDLGRLGARDQAPALVRALRDPRPRVRAAAAVALGRVAVWETIPDLLEALRDDAVEVRREAATAIARITGTDYGFPAEGSRVAREAAIARIRENYAENHGGYLDWMKRRGVAAAEGASP